LAPTILADAPVTQNAAAADNIVKVGWLSEIVNWNPLAIEMVEDYVATYLQYNALFTYDQDWNGPINDLATGYTQVLNGDNSVTWTITITENAYFRNRDNPTDTTHQLTVNDVKYTYDLIIANPGYAWDFYLQNITDITVVNDFTIAITTDFPDAVFIDDLSGIPIVPEFYWSTLSKPFGGMTPDEQMGSSAFYFDDSSTGWYRFLKAPNYFGETDYGDARTIKVDGVMYSIYSDMNALALAVNSGVEDCVVLTGDPDTYMDVLGDGASVNVIKTYVPEPGITDIAINAIPEYFCLPNYGLGNPVLRDPIVREAIMMTLNKEYIVNDMMYGLAIMGDSVVQPNFWHKTIENPLAYDPAGALALLNANGYIDTNGDGIVNAQADSLAVQEGWIDEDAELTNIRCQAPNTDPNYGLIAQAWSGWADDAGIGLVGPFVEDETIMINQAWYKSDYDIWVWHWGWGPEPLGGALSCWLTEEIVTAGDNCQMPMGEWWKIMNEGTADEYAYSSFDENFSAASRELDRDARKLIVDDLQQMVYDSHCENPPYYDVGLYGYTDARYTGWGDWTSHPGRPVTSDLLWLWYDLVPAANLPPNFDTPPLDAYDAIKDQPLQVTIQVSDADDDEITVNWSWGDGSAVERDYVTGTTSSPTTLSRSHTYLAAVTGLYLNISIYDNQTYHEIVSSSTVNVITEPNDGPIIISVTPDPLGPVYVDDVVTWTAVADDNESCAIDGDGLKFTWWWGDGSATVDIVTPTTDGDPVSSVVDHSWSGSGMYNVLVYVWDQYADLPEDNELHNLTLTSPVSYEVVDNTAPSVPDISAISANEDTPVDCIASSSDTDPEGLRFTWDFDDGTTVVDNVANPDPGVVVQSIVEHTWDAAGTYNVTVWVDDLYALEDHNVSSWYVTDIGSVGDPAKPGALQMTYAPSPALEDETVVINISASDANSDPLRFYVQLGDGNETVVNTLGGTTGAQYVEIEHVYENADLYDVVVYVSDETDTTHNTTNTFDLIVISNSPPELTLQTSYSAYWMVPETITPVSVTDEDGDELTVWFDWGDESAMTKGDPEADYGATHTYESTGLFALEVFVNDGMGHNESETSSVTVTDPNFRPSISILRSPAKAEYYPGETVYFNVTVTDFEGDNVTVTIDFDDGSDVETEEVDLEAGVAEVVSFTHEYTVTGSYDVVASVEDDIDHADTAPIEATTNFNIVDEPSEGLSTMAIIGIVVAIAIIALLAAFLLIKRKKKGGEGVAGMEGMAPPESPPAT
jgi:peptide/nickel transport system substrate-binding protein